ncbi:MAG TPA: hypothetical protein VFD73_09460, partial [Gemmatimonadales bacterium]|nr:hypothetical protein [Gemmatimonadales bacterium]
DEPAFVRAILAERKCYLLSDVMAGSRLSITSSTTTASVEPGLTARARQRFPALRANPRELRQRDPAVATCATPSPPSSDSPRLPDLVLTMRSRLTAAFLRVSGGRYVAQLGT